MKSFKGKRGNALWYEKVVCDLLLSFGGGRDSGGTAKEEINDFVFFLLFVLFSPSLMQLMSDVILLWQIFFIDF